MDYSIFMWTWGRYIVLGFILLFVAGWVIGEQLGGMLGETCAPKPGDQFDVMQNLIQYQVAIEYAAIGLPVVGGFIIAARRATRFDSQTYVRRR